MKIKNIMLGIGVAGMALTLGTGFSETAVAANIQPSSKAAITINNLKPVFKQTQIAELVKSLNRNRSNLQIIYPDNKNLTIMLDGGYRERMGFAFLTLPSLSISHNQYSNSLSMNFNNRFGDTEKEFLKNFLKVYYPKSYEKAYKDVVNHKASKGNGNLIKKRYDGRYFSIAKVGKDLMPVIDIGKD